MDNVPLVLVFSNESVETDDEARFRVGGGSGVKASLAREPFDGAHKIAFTGDCDSRRLKVLHLDLIDEELGAGVVGMAGERACKSCHPECYWVSAILFKCISQQRGLFRISATLQASASCNGGGYGGPD